MCQAAQATPVNNCAKLFGSLGTGPTVHPGMLNPSLALRRSMMFDFFSCFCEIQSTHIAGDPTSALRPPLVTVPQVLGDITAHT